MKWINEDKFNAEIDRIAETFNVPASLIKAFIGQESQFNPKAVRNEPAVKDKSIGLMQILFGTAKGEGYTGIEGDAATLSGLYDPFTNIYFGTSYLAEQISRAGGNLANAISAYNGGWRPELGFGAVATRPLTICLARDQVTGKCIKTRNVPVGEYSNQEYVAKILSNYKYFQDKEKTSQTGGGGGPVIPNVTGQAPISSFSPKLLGALVGLLLALFGIKFAGR